MSVRLGLEVGVARTVGTLSRAAGRGGGTTLPGKLLWKIDPGAVDALAARLREGVALVSATNGKTTTTAMAACCGRDSTTAAVFLLTCDGRPCFTVRPLPRAP